MWRNVTLDFCSGFSRIRVFSIHGQSVLRSPPGLVLRQRSGGELQVQSREGWGAKAHHHESLRLRHTLGHWFPLLLGQEQNWLLSITARDGGLGMDLLEGLESLEFEYGMEEEDRSWLYLQGRSRGLMIKACAHATFFCKLLCILR